MTKQGHRKTPHRARSIKTKRDFEGATAAAKRLKAKAERDDAAEIRLQGLLHELDKFDETIDDEDGDGSADYDYPGPARRWSDSTSDRE